jgi:pyruvate-formate lyase-activating enzyme
MASKTQRVKRIRNWKSKAHKANCKADVKRTLKNLEILKKSAA